MEIMFEKGYMPKYDIIRIIFNFCVLKMYLIVMLPRIKRTYDHIDLIEK